MRLRASGVGSVSSALAVRSSVPPLPAATVERPRLLTALDAGWEGALTLVGASPGWGKTVLLSRWAAERGAAWLTLGPRQRRVAAVVRCVRRARPRRRPARRCRPRRRRRGAAARGRARRAAPSARRSCSTTSTCCAGPRSRRWASCSSTAAAACTWWRPPALIRRSRWSGLRLSGRLTELRAADLAFTLPEATAMLEQLGLALRPELVARLLERTEGWAAGLRLAGLSLRGEADPDAFVAEFAGDDRAVADYLTGEVLAGLPAAIARAAAAHEHRRPHLRRARRRAHRRLTAARCCSRSSSARARSSSRSTGTGRWFRYHGLFAELLRARLRLERPGPRARPARARRRLAGRRRPRPRGDAARAGRRAAATPRRARRRPLARAATRRRGARLR